MTSPLKTTTPFGYNPHTAVPPVVDFTPSKPTATGGGGLVDQVKEAWTKVNRFRDGLNLPNPGTFEGVNREVKRKLLREF